MKVVFSSSRIFFIKFDDGIGGLRVQVRRRLVGQDQLGVGDQRPGHGHPLFLPPGDLVGILVLLVDHAHGLQNGHHPFSPFSGGGILDDDEGIFDVLKNRQNRNQVEVLEDEPEVVPPELGALMPVELQDIRAHDG